MIQDKMRLISVIAEIYTAVQKLNNLAEAAYEDMEQEEYDKWNEMISNNYPFAHSSEDTVIDVNRWYEEVIKHKI